MIKDKLGWYTDLNGAFDNGTSKYNYPSSTYKLKSKGYTAGINPGIYYVPVDGLLLSVNAGGISYQYSKNTTVVGKPAEKSSDFTINLFDHFGFGIGFIINKKVQ